MFIESIIKQFEEVYNYYQVGPVALWCLQDIQSTYHILLTMTMNEVQPHAALVDVYYSLVYIKLATEKRKLLAFILNL